MGEPETPLNVLLITCDQWRGDTLGCAGHPVVRTPSLDSLAADGVRFEKHYCQATPCGPSRASLYTGMYQLNTRVVANGTPLSARHSNIALELRRGGYDPVLSGYTDQANDPSTAQGALDPLLHYYGDALPGLRSLNTHPGGSSGHLAVSWVQQLQERGYTVPADMITVGAAKPFGTAEYASAQMPGAVLGGDVDPSRIVGNGGQFMHATHPDGSPVAAFYKPEDGDTAFCVDQVLRHVGSRQGAPWCCHLSAFKPHPPWLAAAPFNEHYTPAQAGLPTHRAASIAEEGKLHPWLAHRLSQTVSTTPDDDAAVALLRSQYWAVCEETDAQLGRLFAALRERGEWERTLIVFTTDHGEQLGDHYMLNKDGFFEQSYHVPLIIRNPNTPPSARGRVVSEFSEHVDVLPTVLDCVALDIPAQADGKSLLPFLHGEDAPTWWRKEAHWEFDYRDRNPPEGSDPAACSLCVLRGERWKYVQFADERMPPLLFDMAAEKGAESVNLALSTNAEHVAAKVDSAMKMLQWRMRHAEHTLTHLNISETGLSDSGHRLSDAVRLAPKL